MTKKLDQIIRKLEKQFPDTWQTRVIDLLERQLFFYENNPSLAKVEILYEFSINKDYKNFYSRFFDLIDSQKVDTAVLYDRFCKELNNFKKEVANT